MQVYIFIFLRFMCTVKKTRKLIANLTWCINEKELHFAKLIPWNPLIVFKGSFSITFPPHVLNIRSLNHDSIAVATWLTLHLCTPFTEPGSRIYPSCSRSLTSVRAGRRVLMKPNRNSVSNATLSCWEHFHIENIISDKMIFDINTGSKNNLFYYKFAR